MFTRFFSGKRGTTQSLIFRAFLLLNESPNLWLGDNAFNSMLHNTLKTTFSLQEKWDKKLFHDINEMV